MADSTPQITPDRPTNFPQVASFIPPAIDPSKPVAELSTVELAQALAERLAIAPSDWHRLKANRKARAAEQTAMALLYLLKEQPPEALERLQQSVGWLDRSISAPPCPTHGH
jgi:Family of unknown function (DUF6439)